MKQHDYSFLYWNTTVSKYVDNKVNCDVLEGDIYYLASQWKCLLYKACGLWWPMVIQRLTRDKFP